MTVVQILGYAAIFLFVVAFAARTIVALRSFAVAASIVLCLYGLFAARYEIAAVGAVLVLLNLWRLTEMRRLVAAVRQASGAPLTVDWLLPYMRPVEIPAGHVLFSKGDKADAMYFVSAGRVHLEGPGLEMTRGSIFGEIGVFSADHRRTATARCVEPCSLLMIDATKVRELYYQNPEFGFYLVGLITERLMQNARETVRTASPSIV